MLKQRTYDIESIEGKLKKLHETNDFANRKSRKKIRQLEYLKKKYTQSENIRNSLNPVESDENELCSSEIVAAIKNDANKTSSTSDEDLKMDVDSTIAKLKRFVVFVGNLPKTVTEENIRLHFKKVGDIKSVRIPPPQESRKNGFAFIELNDRITFEKTLSMHHTMLNNKRINVLYTNPDGTNLDTKEVKKKNLKFNAMRKAGLLIGSVPEHKKRSFRRKKKRLAEQKAAMSVKTK